MDQIAEIRALRRQLAERDQLVRELQQDYWFLEKAQQVAHIGSWISEPQDGGALTWSREVYRIFGVADQDFDGCASTFWSFVHPDERELVRQASRDALAGVHPYDLDHRIVCPDGTIRWVHEAAVVERNEEEQPLRMIGVVQDITERKQMEAEAQWAAADREAALEELSEARSELEKRVEERTAELRRSREQLRFYARRLVEEVEGERAAIARELHDEAGGSLTSILIGLGMVGDECRRSAAYLLEPVEQLKKTTDEVMEALHRISRNLRPPSLDRLGLIPAVRQHIHAFQQQTGIEVDFAPVHFGHELARLPEDIELTVYRVVQEALTNVARHAGAKRVGVILKRRGQRVIVIVEDDGCGFDVSEAANSGRLGLVGMRERAELLGGRFEIESTVGQGTTVFLDLPAITPATLGPAAIPLTLDAGNRN